MKFFITTPIYYVNDQPHLGHAYTTIAADVLARYHRMIGDSVFFLTGTDEHGEKVAQSAEIQGLSPQEICDKNSARFQLVWDVLNISYDNFIRTTDLNHIKAVEKAVEIIFKKNLIYRGTYSGLYCVDCEKYYSRRELVDGKCPYHFKAPTPLSEECYFFKLSAFQKPLLQLISQGDFLIEPIERRNEAISFLKMGLEDLAISRKKEKVPWGIPLPFDKKETLYVWIDAFLNYLTGLNWQGDPNKLSEFWPAEVHLIGKDILRVHATIWPAMLLALEIPLPKKIFAHGFITLAGTKMSKSLGNVIDPIEFSKIFSPDGLRWLTLGGTTFGQDGFVSESQFYDRYNAELANGLGNLFARVLTLALRIKPKIVFSGESYQDFKEMINSAWQKYEKAMESLNFSHTQESVLTIIKFCDTFINKEEPWKLLDTSAPKERERLIGMIYNLLEALRHLSLMINPFMPEISDEIFRRLGLLPEEKKKKFIEAKEWGRGVFKNLERGPALFPRL